MNPILTAFKSSPDKGRGLARDMRVRWALEEVGQPYDVRLFTFPELKQSPYFAKQPFGQIPAFQDGDLTLFESGAILLHIAETHHALLPKERAARARAIAWMFAALSTVEPPIAERSAATLLEADKSWTAERMPMLEKNITTRLQQLSNALGAANWLDDEFGVADILMIHVLRRLERTELLKPFENLLNYIARGEARPAYKRAFAAQLRVYNDSVAT